MLCAHSLFSSGYFFLSSSCLVNDRHSNVPSHQWPASFLCDHSYCHKTGENLKPDHLSVWIMMNEFMMNSFLILICSYKIWMQHCNSFLLHHCLMCCKLNRSHMLQLVTIGFVLNVFKGYEDWLRHKADNEVNGAPVFVVRSGSLVQTRSKNIRVSCWSLLTTAKQIVGFLKFNHAEILLNGPLLWLCCHFNLTVDCSPESSGETSFPLFIIKAFLSLWHNLCLDVFADKRTKAPHLLLRWLTHPS